MIAIEEVSVDAYCFIAFRFCDGSQLYDTRVEPRGEKHGCACRQVSQQQHGCRQECEGDVHAGYGSHLGQGFEVLQCSNTVSQRSWLPASRDIIDTWLLDRYKQIQGLEVRGDGYSVRCRSRNSDFHSISWIVQYAELHSGDRDSFQYSLDWFGEAGGAGRKTRGQYETGSSVDADSRFLARQRFLSGGREGLHRIRHGGGEAVVGVHFRSGSRTVLVHGWGRYAALFRDEKLWRGQNNSVRGDTAGFSRYVVDSVPFAAGSRWSSMKFENFLTLETVVVLAIGMVLGGGAVTWGLADTSSLPPKDEVGEYIEEKLRLDIVKKYRMIGDVEVVSVENTNYPSLYNVTAEFQSVSSNETLRTVSYYVTKDGLAMLGSPRRVVLPEGYSFQDLNATVEVYVGGERR